MLWCLKSLTFFLPLPRNILYIYILINEKISLGAYLGRCVLNCTRQLIIWVDFYIVPICLKNLNSCVFFILSYKLDNIPSFNLPSFLHQWACFFFYMFTYSIQILILIQPPMWLQARAESRVPERVSFYLIPAERRLPCYGAEWLPVPRVPKCLPVYRVPECLPVDWIPPAGVPGFLRAGEWVPTQRLA